MSQQRSQVIQELDRVYAQALAELAQEADRLDVIADQLDELASMVAHDRDLEALLASRVLSREQRDQAIERIFADNVDELLYRFLRVLNDKDRLGRLVGVARALRQKRDELAGVVSVELATAAPLEDPEALRLATRLGQILGGSVSLKRSVDPELLGGLRLRVGDESIDASAAAQLRLMKQRMIRTGREHARRLAQQESQDGG